MDERTEAQKLKSPGWQLVSYRRRDWSQTSWHRHSGLFAYLPSDSIKEQRGGCGSDHRVLRTPGNKAAAPATKEGQGQCQKPELVFLFYYFLSVTNVLGSTTFSLGVSPPCLSSRTDGEPLIPNIYLSPVTEHFQKQNRGLKNLQIKLCLDPGQVWSLFCGGRTVARILAMPWGPGRV